MSKPIVLFSGGLDSTVLLWSLRPNVKALLFDYGQRHRKELFQAAAICEQYQIEFEVAQLHEIQNLLKGSSQTDPTIPVPEGHYTEESMKATIVPNRNMIMGAIAVGWAVSTGSEFVYTAVHAGDHFIYPDCRPEFVLAMQAVVLLANDRKVNFLAPFADKTKADIVGFGNQLHAPMDQSWSCYKGGILHCGSCGTCVERKEAFQLAGVVDPTEYEK